MTYYIALWTLLLWPVIPLHWIPVHLATPLFRGLGGLTFGVTLILWLIAAAFIHANQAWLLAMHWQMPATAAVPGLLLLTLGLLLQLWTFRLLSARTIFGFAEIDRMKKGHLVDCGAFSVARHPTYLAHTLMLAGIFLFTGYAAVGALCLIDFFVVNFIVIPLEERELLQRFGAEYLLYQRRVRRLIPGVW